MRNVVQAEAQRQYMCMPDRPPVSWQELRGQGCWRADDAVRAAAAQPMGVAAAGTAEEDGAEGVLVVQPCVHATGGGGGKWRSGVRTAVITAMLLVLPRGERVVGLMEPGTPGSRMWTAGPRCVGFRRNARYVSEDGQVPKRGHVGFARQRKGRASRATWLGILGTVLSWRGHRGCGCG